MSLALEERGRALLHQFRDDRYVFGIDCLGGVGELARPLGRRAALIAGGSGQAWGQAAREKVSASLGRAGVELTGAVIPGAKPNSPYPDVFRIAEALRQARADVIVAVGGGSVIDAAKAAIVLAAMGDGQGDLEPYFGMGKVSELLQRTGRTLTPMLAVQLAASSAAHLTKYSNLTNPQTSQKKLIIDDAIVPARALFDYALTTSMSPEFTADGALDGLSHCLEVFYGLKDAALEKVWPISTLGVELIVANVQAACRDGSDLHAREALGLATDLGGYAIMVGGTSGAHLNSFSLVDLLSHGRACALLNPYYTVFFAPAIEPQLRAVADIFRRGGLLRGETEQLHGRELGLAVAEAMIALSRSIGFPTRLADVPGFAASHIDRAIEAAKNPQLESKLRNMPVPLSTATVDQYMRPVLEAASSGDLSLIRNMERQHDGL